MRFATLLALAGCAIGTLKDDDDTADLEGQCTSLDCYDGFLVGLVKDTWNRGIYVFDIDVDGSGTSCTYTIPLGTESTDGCESSEVLIGNTGGFVDEADQAFYEILLGTTTATQVTITITHDGVQIGSETFTPAYELYYPNGTDCDPVCTYDEDAMIL